jgi:hypothetical protein
MSVALLADERTILLDEEVDFSTFSTFTVSNIRITSDRPELNVPIVSQSIADAVRRALSNRGLKENAPQADLVVEVQVTGVDFEVGPFGRPSVIESGRVGRGRREPQAVHFTEATMVVDAYRLRPRALIWRAVYRIAEDDAQKLVSSLPKNAFELLSQFPRRRR